MLDFLIKNGTILTQNNKREVLIANIGIEKGIIRYIGNKNLNAKKVIDASKYIITPGFVNAHIHFGEYYLRGYHGNINTEEYILLGEKFYKKFKDKNDYIRKSSIYNVVYESILSGSLTLMGVRGWPYVSEMPVNAFLGYPIMNSDKKGQYIDNFEQRFFGLEMKENTKYFIGLHSTKWVDEKILIRLSEFIKKNQDIKLTVHVCESKQEIEYVKKNYGITPIELLYKYNLLSKNTLLIHCCYLNKQDIKMIKETGASVSVCFNSNLKLGNKCCDVEDLLENNINVMIGTDGPATCDSVNILDTAKTTALITRIPEQDIFDMITINPSKYLEINTGKIENDYKADLLFFEKASTRITYTNSIINNLIYSPDIRPVYIMKDGKMVLEDNNFMKKAKEIRELKLEIINYIEKNNLPN